MVESDSPTLEGAIDVGMVLLRRDRGAAASARRQVARDLRRHQLTPDSVDDVVLVISELVSNAVLHAHVGRSEQRDATDGLDVAWDFVDDRSSCAVIVRVNDTSSAPPSPREAGPLAKGGRGLAIVAALAEEWGVRPQAFGKQVWARIAVRRAV